MRSLLISSAIVLGMTFNAHAQPQFQQLPSGMVLNAPASSSQNAPTPDHILKEHSPATMATARDGEVINSIGSGAIPELPLEVQNENGISYLNGGIGDEEVAQIKSAEAAYNLRVQISGQSGEYLSNVSFVLLGNKTRLVTIAEAGPYVYLNVPAGNYQIDVNAASGAKASVPVSVPANKAVKKAIRL
jgi:hypothetical protein